MVYEKRGRFCFRDDSGRLFKFKTQQEAEKAADLSVANDNDALDDFMDTTINGNEETQETSEAPDYGWQVEDEEVDTEE